MGTTPNYVLPYPEATDPADVPTDIHELATAVEATLRPAVVATLPTTGLFDGLEVYYAANAANGVYWHLRYRSGATGAYKWEFVGGSAIAVEALAISSVTAMPANSWGGQTVPINLTLPLAGDYDLLHVGVWRNNSVAASIGMGERLGAGAPDPGVGEYAYQATPGAGAWTTLTHRRRISGRPAAQVISEVFQTSAQGDIARQGGRLEVQPVRVG